MITESSKNLVQICKIFLLKYPYPSVTVKPDSVLSLTKLPLMNDNNLKHHCKYASHSTVHG